MLYWALKHFRGVDLLLGVLTTKTNKHTNKKPNKKYRVTRKLLERLMMDTYDGYVYYLAYGNVSVCMHISKLIRL